MTDRRATIADHRALGLAPYDAEAIRDALHSEAQVLRFPRQEHLRMERVIAMTLDIFDRTKGKTLAERWVTFEATTWAGWWRGQDRLPIANIWTWGVWPLVCGRFVRPSYAGLEHVRVKQWADRLPADDPLFIAKEDLWLRLEKIGRFADGARRDAVVAGLRLLLTSGRDEFTALTPEDLARFPPRKGADVLDLVLSELGVTGRDPLRGGARHRRTERMTPAELVASMDVPSPFVEIMTLYLETYDERISGAYSTLRGKVVALGHWFRYLAEHCGIDDPADVRATHAQGFFAHAAELAAARARHVQGGSLDPARMTGYSWIVNVRTFYTDVCTWATESGSPFADLVPPAVPFDRRDLRERGVLSTKRRVAARMTATVLELERAMPQLRAFALRQWHEASGLGGKAEQRAFWDWALLELLVTSGLRVEEAAELTTLDVLRRELRDGRVYYLLHIKPSKFGAARVIPIGDVLGRVIAEIVRHVKAFYGTDAVPFVDRRDHHEKVPLPRAPYLLQGYLHPSAFGVNTIRWKLAELSRAAGITAADGTPLIVRPHDCRRVFATEQLNNNTPVHVIGALLGHATLDTVMIYAKLYPSTLVAGYRKALRGVYTDVYGTSALRTPSAEEWAAFAKSCSLRDMGTHVCALPAGDHCSRGLVCLGCGHAQPKRSALPVFKRMLASHERALVKARGEGEPAGQLAARELEVERIRSAMHRAGELTEGVADALEAV